MQATVAILKKELLMYFKSPIAYVLIAIYTFVSSLVFSLYLFQGYSLLASELNFLQSLFFIIIPLMTMKSFSEENRNKTDLLLLTSPCKIIHIVLGKYLACVIMFAIMSFITLIHVLVTIFLGGNVDLPLLGTVIIYFLTAFAYIAIGIYCSSFTENQIIAGIISMLIFLLFSIYPTISNLISNLISSVLNSLNSIVHFISPEIKSTIASKIASGLNWLNPSNRLAEFTKGIFSVPPIIFLLTYAFVFLYLTCKVLQKRRWN